MTEQTPKDSLATRIAALPPEKRALLEQKLREKQEAERKRIQKQSRDGRSFPMSFEQERMWFIQTWDPSSSLYNGTLAITLSGRLDIDLLARSINEIVRRHEVLRTTFCLQDMNPVQIIAPELEVTLPVEDLRRLPEAVREAEFYRLAREEIRRSFDLTQLPLFRVPLYRLSDTEAILVFSIHHIIHDGLSIRLFIQELASIYGSLVTNTPSPLSDLPIQFADFAVWQRDYLQSQVLGDHLSYWKQQLAGIPQALVLPTDRPRPPVLRSYGAQLPLMVERTLSDGIKAFGRDHGATPFMVLLAAYAVLLSRLSGQEDIVIGTPIANREFPEVEGLIGLFMNMLALRVDLRGDPSFREVLERVRQVTVDAYAHQSLPFARLVSELEPTRSMTHTPIFQVSMGIQRTPVMKVEAPGLSIDMLERRWLMESDQLPPLHKGMALFELTFNLSEIPKGLGGLIEYNTDLFDSTTVTRWISHYKTLIRNALANPDQHISRLSLWSEDELRQVLVEWNATAVAYPENQCIHRLFEEQVGRTPDRLAVQMESSPDTDSTLEPDDRVCERLTYTQLNAYANQLARYLQTLGVGPETPVAICMERSPDIVIAILGVLKAGGVYLPLDPHYPAHRLEFILRDAQAAVVLTQQASVERLPAHSARVVCLDADWAAVKEFSPDNLPQENLAENLAYIIYTSGSTGQPKGVMLAHAGVNNLVQAQVEAFAIQPDSQVLQFASPSFDASVSEIFTCLLAGATLHIGGQAALMPGPKLVQLMREQAISVVTFPPTVLSALPTTDFPALKSLVSAGEACTPDIVKRWAPGRRFINAYGPTEATVCVTCTQLTGETDTLPIGRPVANKQVYVVDQNLAPTPLGVPGELLTGGAGLARGYLGRPDLTAEKFIPDPFSGQAGARLYRTGDLVRYQADGQLEFLGRIDHQVKVRGFRIELDEIEAVLKQHPSVREAAVMLQSTQRASDSIAVPSEDDQQLVAYCIPAADVPKLHDLREFLQQRLPDYMVPGAFVLVNAFPLLPSGKVDRLALATAEQIRLTPEQPYASPRNEAEEALARIWAVLLGVERVGIHDNFFELGGDSIRSIQVAAAAAQSGLKLTSQQIFQHQTIAELATVVGSAPVTHAEQGLVTGAVPFTPIQHWFFEKDMVDYHHWNQCLFFTVPERLEPSALEKAVATLLLQHDALRLRFTRSEQGWEQTGVAPDGDTPFECVNMTPIPPAERRALLETRAAQAQTSLNLEHGPLLRVIYFDLGVGQPGRLLFVIHHLAVDSVSWGSLVEDLLVVYRQTQQGQTISLPAKTTSFQHWANRLVDYAQSDILLEQANYWLSEGRQHVSPLPVDFVDGLTRNTEETVKTVTVTLSVEETRSLTQEVHTAYNTRTVEILLAALAQAVAEWSGEWAMLVDMEGHGREPLFEDVDLTRTVGWFTSLFPVLLEIEAVRGAGDLIKYVKELVRAIPQQGIGYGILRYLRQPPDLGQRLASLPQAQMSFNYVGQFGIEYFGPAPENSGPTHSPAAPRQHEIEILGQIVQGQLQMDFYYSQAIHRHETIARLADAYAAALRALIGHCLSPEAGDYTPSDFPEAELTQDGLDNLLSQLGDLAL